MILGGTNFISSFEVEPNVRAILTDDSGFVLLGHKTTTGFPSVIANIYQSGCMVYNVFDGGINLNVGTLAAPTWKLMAVV